MNADTANTPKIDPGTQTREQRFWLLDNGFQLAQDTMGETWLYTFRAGPVLPKSHLRRRASARQFCVGVYQGGWAVYYCGSLRTTVLFRGESFKAVLGYALQMMRGQVEIPAGL